MERLQAFSRMHIINGTVHANALIPPSYN